MLDSDKAKLIKGLKKLDTTELTHFIKHLDKNGIEHLCECMYNTIYTNLNLPKNKRRKIKAALNNDRSRKNLGIITKKRSSIAKKRAALSQEGEGLGLILSAIAPLIASLFTRK